MRTTRNQSFFGRMEIQQGNFHLIEHYVEIISSAENLLQAESGTVQTLLNMKNNIRRMQEDLSLSSDQFEKKVSQLLNNDHDFKNLYRREQEQKKQMYEKLVSLRQEMVEKSMREKEAAEGFHSAFTKLKLENKELSLQLDFMKKIKIPQLSRQIDEQKEKFKQNERQNQEELRQKNERICILQEQIFNRDQKMQDLNEQIGEISRLTQKEEESALRQQQNKLMNKERINHRENLKKQKQINVAQPKILTEGCTKSSEKGRILKTTHSPPLCHSSQQKEQKLEPKHEYTSNNDNSLVSSINAQSDHLIDENNIQRVGRLPQRNANILDSYQSRSQEINRQQANYQEKNEQTHEMNRDQEQNGEADED